MAKLVYANIPDQIANHIRSEILSGQLEEGEQLKEQHLAKKYGVSRGPIRDALLKLSKEGILEAKPNCGMRVGTLPSAATRRLLVKLRRQIEVFALGEIFDKITESDLQDFQENLKQFKEACEQNEMSKVVALDMAFHQMIVERASGANVLSVWLPIMMQMRLPYSRHESLLESYKEHQKIYDAICKKQKKDAIKNLEKNIQ